MLFSSRARRPIVNGIAWWLHALLRLTAGVRSCAAGSCRSLSFAGDNTRLFRSRQCPYGRLCYG